VTPDIRAYNRISPYIAFLALAGVALWGDRVIARVSSWWRAGFWIVVLSVGLIDQQSVFRRLTADGATGAAEFDRVSTFVKAVESQLADGAMVYQLPVVPYPLDAGLERLAPYEQFRPYAITHRLRWSYPALTKDQREWEQGVAKLDTTELPRYLAQQGFSLILISRAGYADRGVHLEQALQDLGAGATLLAANQDYVALDLRPLRPSVAR
jgi:phosphoglycerol transferase